MAGAKKSRRRGTSLPRWRLASQLTALVLLNPVLYRAQEFCVPVLNCWACPLAAFGCPVGLVGSYLSRGLVPFMTIGTVMLAGAAFGRLLCGWACPFGLLQDALFRVRTRKLALPHPLRYGKYLFLVGGVIVVAWFFGTGPTPEKAGPEDAFFCNYCPAGTLEAALPRALIGHFRAGTETPSPLPSSPAASPAVSPQDQLSTGPVPGETSAAPESAASIRGGDEGLVRRILTSLRVWLLAAFLAAFVLFKRPLCRAVCPIGAALALFNKVSLYRMRLWPEKCVECGRCQEACPVDLYFPGDPNTPECVRCLECRSTCPTGAIR